MSDSTNLGLPYIFAAQAQKHVTHNEAIRALDCLVQLSVVSRTLTAPPGSPVEGSRYIVAAGPTGAWAGQADTIAAFQDGSWEFYAPKEGWIAWVAADANGFVYASGAWSALPSSGGVSDHGALTGLGDDDHTQYLTNTRGDARYVPLSPATLGINATATTTNRLALSSAASLFNHDGAGHQVKVNKNTAADTASFLFQDGFSGRAEIGLAGDDDFHFKVSPDGSAWNEAIKINKSTGEVTFPAAAQTDVQRFTSSGTWTKPNGAKMCRIVITGAGGGGGGGGKASSGSAVSGGGGGGGSGRTELFVDTSALGSSETVTVGTGGAGGAGATANGAGSDGSAGGNSSFGSVGTAFGGGGGSGGNIATASAGGGGGSQRAAGGNASGATAGNATQSVAGTAGASGGNATTATSNTGGAGGGGCSAAGVAGAGAGSLTAGGGGSAGGGVTSGNVFQAGAAAAAGWQTSNSASGGSTDASSGGSAATQTLRAGGGAGGGGGSVSSNGGGGGTGGPPGGGGGGGGASQGGNGGTGGAGGRGEVMVITYR